MTVVILGRPSDPFTRTVAAALGQAELIVPSDLSKAGWCLGFPQGERAQLVASGRVLLEDDVDGAVCVLACITPRDLPHIRANDRVFAAREMTAMLYACLARLGARACNPPSPRSLCGEVPVGARRVLADCGIPEAAGGARGATGGREAQVVMVGSDVGEVLGNNRVLTARLSRDTVLLDKLRTWFREVPLRMAGVRLVLNDNGAWEHVSVTPNPVTATTEGLAALRNLLRPAVSG